MSNIYNDIESLLKKISPNIFDSFNGPAGQEAIAKIEAALGFALPNDLKSLYEWKDGIKPKAIASLCNSFSYHPSDKLIEYYNPEYRLKAENLINVDAELKQLEGEFKMIELGSDSGRCFLCLNITGYQGPSDSYQVAVVDNDYRVAFKLADSIEDLMKTFAEDLTAGKYHLDPEALDDGVEFVVPESSIDMCNWFKTEKYKHFLG